MFSDATPQVDIVNDKSIMVGVIKGLDYNYERTTLEKSVVVHSDRIAISELLGPPVGDLGVGR